MDSTPTMDEAIDSALDLLETDQDEGDVANVVTWVTDNLICELDQYQNGNASRCAVGGYEVCRIGEEIIILAPRTEVLDSFEARRVAVALLRAAEAADSAIL